MTDIRRTILWVVFSMSLLLIWDAWQKHNGHPSLFNPAPKPTAVGLAAGRRDGGGRVGRRRPVGRAVAGGDDGRRRRTAGAGRAGATAAVAAEQVDIVTDLREGDLRQPRRRPGAARAARPGRPERPAAQRAAVRPLRRARLPGAERPHPGGRRRRAADAPDADEAAARRAHAQARRRRAEAELRVARDRRREAGQDLHLPPRQLRRRRARTRSSTPRRRRSRRSSTCSWCATATRLRASRASTSPSPARPSTTRRRSSPRSTSRTSRSARKARSSTTRPRPPTAGWRWCSTTSPRAWILPTGMQREYLQPQGRRQPVLGRHDRAARHARAGRLARRSTRTLFAGPQEENKLLERWPPGWSWSRTTAGSPSSPSRCSGCSTKLHGLLGNWGWSIVALVLLLKIGVLLAQRQRLQVSMAKMKAINPKVMALRERLQGQPAADAAGDDAHLPRGEGQPGRRLPADHAADAGLHRALLGAAVERGDAQRAVDRLDHRPVGARPVLHPAAAHDRHHAAADLR